MDRVGAGERRHPDDLRHREIGLDRAHSLADLIGRARLEAMQRQLVLFREDGDRRQPQLVRRPEHPDCDLGTVGDERFCDFGQGLIHAKLESL